MESTGKVGISCVSNKKLPLFELYQYQGDIEQGRYRYRTNRAGETGRTQVGNDPIRGVTAEYAVSLRDEQVRAVLREDRRASVSLFDYRFVNNFLKTNLSLK
jgi:hypothetical protein